MIGIRVDINETIATGHFMRCLSIAQGLRNAKYDVIFISADERAKKLSEQYGFQAIQLNTKWDEMDSEFAILSDIICRYHIDKLFVDSYYVTERYLRNLYGRVELIYIDDINKFRYPVDILINYNAYYDRFNYTQTYRNTNTRLVLGLKYVPLRSEFRGIKREVKEAVKNILITTGGTDTYDIAEHLLEALKNEADLTRINVHIVTGRYSQIGEKIEHWRLPNVYVHKNVNSMSELMRLCDIAITAGGSTMYELCACGLPSVSFTFANNQLFAVEALDNMGIIPYSGDARNGINECIAKIMDRIRYYIVNYEVRKQRSQAMQDIVDGFGVDRIVGDVFGS